MDSLRRPYFAWEPCLTEFIELCLTPPAFIFTILMVPVAFYWLLSIFGSFLHHGADVHHGGGHHADAAHGHDGHDGHHGSAAHSDGDLAPGDGQATWGGLGYGEVPRVLSLSLLIFFGWSSSLAALWLYPPLAGIAERALWIGAGLSALFFAFAFGAAALAVRPINKLLVAGAGPRRNDLVGKLCTVRTQRVDDGFGQAEVDHASSLVQVRELFGRSFKYGQRALIYDYDEEREVFLIAPFDPVSGKIDIPGRQALPQAPVAASDDASESLPASRRGVKE
jgi:hypothetical protein